jgi:transposase
MSGPPESGDAGAPVVARCRVCVPKSRSEGSSSHFVLVDQASKSVASSKAAGVSDNDWGRLLSQAAGGGVNADRKQARASLLHEWRCVLRKAS